MLDKKTAIIIGAGPAGITAARELQKKTKITPVIFEMTDKIGGISRTEHFKGNKIDIGGHRFFTKNDNVLKWWLHHLPLQESAAVDGDAASGLNTAGALPEKTDAVMLVRKRQSSILFNNCFFDYPLSLNWQTLSQFGIGRSCFIISSYIWSQLFPIRNEKSLEDFLVNRFGRQLFDCFFKDYTEKLWGVPCASILPDWGAQRVKNLSMAKAIYHAVRQKFFQGNKSRPKDIVTSLIDEFLYPKYGPGQLWEAAAAAVREGGGKIYLNHKVTGLRYSGSRVSAVQVQNRLSGELKEIKGDYFISTMPVKYLIKGMGDTVPKEVQTVAENLYYRDLIVVGLLLSGLKLSKKDGGDRSDGRISDNWIYIQDKNINVGRIQFFNNWNPYMVADPDTVWMGLEVCCSAGDAIWNKPDDDIVLAVVEEMSRLNILDKKDVLDAMVVRQPQAYPGYTEAYKQFEIIRKFTDTLHNLFLIGRNGMHRYNNMDHSMLTAMQAVDNIAGGNISKQNIWDVNADEDYHETKHPG